MKFIFGEMRVFVAYNLFCFHVELSSCWLIGQSNYVEQRNNVNVAAGRELSDPFTHEPRVPNLAGGR
jgi:hypothetical protein